MVRKYFRRMARKGKRMVKRAIKKRYGTWKSPKLGNVVKDVMFLKTMINAEKKRYRFASSAQQAVSQVTANASGHWVFDCTPTPTQGSGFSERNGSSIKVHSSYMKFQFYQQANTTQPIRLRMYYILVKGDPALTNTVVTEFLAANQWIYNQNTVTIRDFNSVRNPDYYGDYRVLQTKTFMLKPDAYSGQTQIKDIVIKHKYNRGKGHHIRFDANSQTLSNGQLVLLCVADNGNQSGATASTLNGIPTSGVLSGAVFNYDITHYYIDN